MSCRFLLKDERPAKKRKVDKVTGGDTEQFRYGAGANGATLVPFRPSLFAAQMNAALLQLAHLVEL